MHVLQPSVSAVGFRKAGLFDPALIQPLEEPSLDFLSDTDLLAWADQEELKQLQELVPYGLLQIV